MAKLKKDKTQIKLNQPSDKLLLAGFLSLILLHIVGGFWHSYYSWGFSYWSVFPTDMIYFFGILSTVSLSITYYYRSKIRFDFLNRLNFSNRSKQFRLSFISLTLFLTTCTLYFFCPKVHIYGDGYLILNKVLSVEDMLLDSKNFMELFTIQFYNFITSQVQWFGTISREVVLGTINSIAGAFGLWAIWSISKCLGSSRERRSFIFISALLVLFLISSGICPRNGKPFLSMPSQSIFLP